MLRVVPPQSAGKASTASACRPAWSLFRIKEPPDYQV